jgi:hypothetical protein
MSLGVMALGGYFYGDEDDWASREQIIAAGERCGIMALQRTRTGNGWAAPISDGLRHHQATKGCIYTDLTRQGLLAVR